MCCATNVCLPIILGLACLAVFWSPTTLPRQPSDDSFGRYSDATEAGDVIYFRDRIPQGRESIAAFWECMLELCSVVDAVRRDASSTGVELLDGGRRRR